jgi:hypothetical protein
MDDESRRAQGRYELSVPGRSPISGEGDLEVTDGGISAGGVAVEFLDADSLRDADRVLTLGLFPEGSLTVSLLGRRHETFAAALGEARDRARLAGLLAHGVTEPDVFEGSLRSPGPTRGARLLVYATHLAVAPDGGDPFQIPYGTVTGFRFDESAWSVTVDTAETPYVFGRLARRTDVFYRAVFAARDARAKRLAEISGSPLFADGAGVPAKAVRDFDRLVDAWSAPERVEGAAAILSRAPRGEARIGLVELLDPDAESLAARAPLPENVAAFLLAPIPDRRVVLELLSGPSAATYVFAGDVETTNRDLQALHFRRRPLALSESEAAGEAGRAYRLALRRLEPLKRLRAATAARLVHDEGWADRMRDV